MQNQPEELKKIRSILDADNFFWWLTEHPEVTMIQGWVIERAFANDGTGDNRPTAFGTSPRHSCDVVFLYTERKAINDWIERKLEEEKVEKMQEFFGYADWLNEWEAQNDPS